MLVKTLYIRNIDDWLHQRIIEAARKDGRTLTEWVKRTLAKMAEIEGLDPKRLKQMETLLNHLQTLSEYHVKPNSTDANKELDK